MRNAWIERWPAKAIPSHHCMNITATGEVQIINADGSVEYADHIVLADKM